MKPTKIFDPEKTHFNIARLKKEGDEYQIVVDPDKAVEFKEGEVVDVKDVLKSEGIFFDAKKGEHAGEERMSEVFGTEDHLEIAKIILTQGEVQLTAEHRAKVRETKRKRIIFLISQNACDPKTKLPHPPNRIEAAMEEAKVRIDEFKRASDQVQDIIKLLRPIIPISIEQREVSVHIPSQMAGKAYSIVQQYATIKEESWENDGSWTGIAQLPAGMLNDFIDKLNNDTHGSVQTEIIR